MKPAKTVDAVIKALGGAKTTAEFAGRSLQAVTNWRRDGRFPANLFVRFKRELKAHGYEVVPSLWGQLE